MTQLPDTPEADGNASFGRQPSHEPHPYEPLDDGALSPCLTCQYGPRNPIHLLTKAVTGVVAPPRSFQDCSPACAERGCHDSTDKGCALSHLPASTELDPSDHERLITAESRVMILEAHMENLLERFAALEDAHECWLLAHCTECDLDMPWRVDGTLGDDDEHRRWCEVHVGSTGHTVTTRVEYRHA